MAKSWRASLPMILCGVFLFCSHVLAASAVLGVDLGTEYIKAAIIKPGIPLEIVLTKDSRRKETSAVAFKPLPGGPKAGLYPERVYGSDAMALAARFPGDVYPNLKTLLGLPVEGNPVVQEYADRHPALKLEAHRIRKTAAFKSPGAFSADEEAWLVEELLAMELQSVRHNAESLAGAGTLVRSAVITVPPFYTTEEKRAVEMAAELAGLRVLSLISDGLAVGLHYATSRQFPSISDGGKPELHMVFDMGAGSTKATILRFQSRSVKDIGKFNKTVQEVQVLGSGWDRTLGGDALNALIVDDMLAQFAGSAGAKAVSATVDTVKRHGRAVAKLSKEAERVRHVLSANTNTAASFEGLYDDVDFRYKISRPDFEAMAEPYVARVAAAVQQALDKAGLQVADLDSVILHGGATRTPFVQKQLELIFGSADKLRSNVNSDEAAVFGAGFRAAEISPSFRVKEIRVFEAATYGAGMKWTNSKTNKVQTQQLWAPTSYLGAAPKEVTFKIKEDFTVDFFQLSAAATAGEGSASSGYAEAPTKSLTTTNLTDTVALVQGEKYACDPNAIQFKLGLRLSAENGEVDVTSVFVECEAEEPEKESLMDGVKNLFGFGGKNKQDGETEDDATAASSSSSSSTSSSTSSTSSAKSSTTTSSGAASSTPVSKSAAGKKVVVKVPVKYALQKTGIPSLSKAEMQKLKDRLKAFEASDHARRFRDETLNQLEAFTYKVQGLLENEEFIAVATEEEVATLQTLSHETSDWLYDDGVDATQPELKKRHDMLKALADPIVARIEENEKRPALIVQLKESLKQSAEFSQSARKQIEEYESFQAARSASAAASSETVPAAAVAEDEAFVGLEDEDKNDSGKKAAEVEDDPLLASGGPLRPMYSLEDLQEAEALEASVSAWLAEKEAEQAKLGPKDNAVLKVKDLQAKRAQIDKMSVDLAMRAVRNFEKTQKKTKTSEKKSSKTKRAKTSTTAASSSATAATTEATTETMTIKPSSATPSAETANEHDEL